MRLPAVVLFVGLWVTGCNSDPAAPHVATVPAGAMADPARGELLYKTVCASCHTEETHWRSQHLVQDWPSLLRQIARWQSVAGQSWGTREMQDVGAYLNREFYDLPCPVPRCSAGTVGVAPHGAAPALLARTDAERLARSVDLHVQIEP